MLSVTNGLAAIRSENQTHLEHARNQIRLQFLRTLRTDSYLDCVFVKKTACKRGPPFLYPMRASAQTMHVLPIQAVLQGGGIALADNNGQLQIIGAAGTQAVQIATAATAQPTAPSPQQLQVWSLHRLTIAI